MRMHTHTHTLHNFVPVDNLATTSFGVLPHNLLFFGNARSLPTYLRTHNLPFVRGIARRSSPGQHEALALKMSPASPSDHHVPHTGEPALYKS